MMGKPRLDLHEEICGLLGSRNAYFQPPESIKLKYDCCVYRKKQMKTTKADNLNYLGFQAYELLFIYRDPDSDLMQRCIEHFQYCTPGQPYVVDNLYHWPATVYY